MHEKKALSSRGWGRLRGFLELQRPWGFLPRHDEDLRQPLVRCQGSQVSMRVARGSASLLSSHGRGLGPRDALKDSRSFSGDGGKPSFPSPSAGDLRELSRAPLRGEGSCGGGGAPRDSAWSGAMEEGLTSRGGRNLRLPLRFGLRPQRPCRVGTRESGLVLSEEGNPAGLSRCSGGLRPLVELCVEPAGLCGRCTGVAVPLRVVPSPTGLPSKRSLGLGSFSRADRGIGGVRHVAPPTWLVSNFLVRTSSS